MKKNKTFPQFKKHLRNFILLSIVIYSMFGIIHINILARGNQVSFGDVILPQSVSYFALLAAISMVVMGIYYYVALGSEKNK